MKFDQLAYRRPSMLAMLFVVVAKHATVASEPRVLNVAASPIALPLAIVTGHVGKDDASRSLGLIELDEEGAVSGSAFPVQLVPAAAAHGTKLEGTQQLLAVVPPGDAAGGVRQFRLQGIESTPAGGFHFENVSDASLGLWQGDHPVLVYNYGDIIGQHVPQNDPRRRRACYIHPIWGHDGEVITGDFPQDHYHHHGLFWAWPHVRIGEKEYNLWTYADVQQRFVRWICRRAGPVAAVLAVENGWFVGQRQVMIERVWMRAFMASGGRRALDVTLTWIPMDRAVTLWGAEGKSYGGLAMRFGPRDDKQTVITVPGGRAREDLLHTPLPWAEYTSQFAAADGASGATVMIDPAHPDFPPTWLTRHYGALCVGYPGVHPKTFSAGESFTLNYRVSVHDGPARLAELEQDYEGYISTLEAHWSE